MSYVSFSAAGLMGVMSYILLQLLLTSKARLGKSRLLCKSAWYKTVSVLFVLVQAPP